MKNLTSLEVMNYSHPKWELFLSKLDIELRKNGFDINAVDENGCNHNYNLSCKVLLEYFPDVSAEKTLAFFKSEGGYCDCEVMYNVMKY